jgi:signal transduction histidine kinase
VPAMNGRAVWATAGLVDAVLIAGMLGYAVGYLLVLGRGGIYSPAGLLAVLVAISACLVLSRQRPLLAIVLTAGLDFALGTTFDVSDSGPDAADGLFAVAALMIYRLSVQARPAVSLLAAVLFAASLEVAELIEPTGRAATFNPFLIVEVVGPWIVGLIVRARGAAQDELLARQRELEAEQARYARESVRYERARIARELHDIVAHNVSLMVVQASAGHVLATRDPALVEATFDNIADSAHQAELEIDRLIALLDGDAAPAAESGLTMIDELIRRATATGLSVTYRLAGAVERLDPVISRTAYRVVQESLTNALKHAPGAAIAVSIEGSEAGLDVSVSNDGAPAGAPSTLGAVGGGHGIGGLRERVAGAGGVLDVGPEPAGGWRVRARLPWSPGPGASR